MKDYSIQIYIANEGDTVDSICERFHITKQMLYIFNPLLKNKVKISNIPIKIPYLQPVEKAEEDRAAEKKCPVASSQGEEKQQPVPSVEDKKQDIRCLLLPFVVLIGQCKEALLIKQFLPSLYKSYEQSNRTWLHRSLSGLSDDQNVVSEAENYYATLMAFDDVLSQEDETAIGEHLKHLSDLSERIRSLCPEKYRKLFSEFHDFCIQYFIQVKMENYTAANEAYLKIVEKLNLEIAVVG